MRTTHIWFLCECVVWWAAICISQSSTTLASRSLCMLSSCSTVLQRCSSSRLILCSSFWPWSQWYFCPIGKVGRLQTHCSSTTLFMCHGLTWSYLTWNSCPHYFNLATSETWCWDGGRGILTKLSLCYSIVYDYDDAQRYKQFLQVGRLYLALIFLGLVLCLLSPSVSSVFTVLYIYLELFLLPSLPFSELTLVILALDLVD